MKQNRIAAAWHVRSESSEPEGETLADTEETAGASEGRETGGQEESGSNGKTDSTDEAENQGEEESLPEEDETDIIVTAQGKRVQGIAFIADAETSAADESEGQGKTESAAVLDSTEAAGQYGDTGILISNGSFLEIHLKWLFLF